MNTNKNLTLPILVGVAIVTILTIAGVWASVSSSNNSANQAKTEQSANVTKVPEVAKLNEVKAPDSEVPAMATSNPETINNATTETVKTASKNGIFNAEGPYNSPAGPENIKVSLTVQEGLITDVKVTPEATNGVSKKFQDLFAEGVKGKIVGKSIDDTFPSGNINGASLTTNGFIKALNQIQMEVNQK